MATCSARFKVSAVAATTVTLVPADGQAAPNDFGPTIAQIVVTFTGARPTSFLDAATKQAQIEIHTL